jgi:SOS response associated peptidase (SRAP)
MSCLLTAGKLFPSIRARLSDLYRLSGNLPKAEALASEAATSAQSFGIIPLIPRLLNALAEIQIDQHKYVFILECQDDSLFAFAGIWNRWKNGGGDPVETCSILTTTPNALLAAVHDRMPVILDHDDYELWLDPRFKDINALSEMLRPFNAGLMKSYPVSTRVNAPKNDDPECAAEIALQGATDRAEQLLPRILLP